MVTTPDSLVSARILDTIMDVLLTDHLPGCIRLNPFAVHGKKSHRGRPISGSGLAGMAMWYCERPVKYDATNKDHAPGTGIHVGVGVGKGGQRGRVSLRERESVGDGPILSVYFFKTINIQILKGATSIGVDYSCVN